MSNNVPNAPAHSDPDSMTTDVSEQSARTETMPTALDVDTLDIDALLDIADAVDITWVREQSQLDEVIDALATCGRVALDTEFIKRDTYYPRLALVQLNTGDHVYLLDAPQLQLAELWEALRKVEVADNQTVDKKYLDLRRKHAK